MFFTVAPFEEQISKPHFNIIVRKMLCFTMHRKNWILLDAVRSRNIYQILRLFMHLFVKSSQPPGEVEESLFPPYGGEYWG